MTNTDDDHKLLIEAAIGLLKLNSGVRRKRLGEKVKKTAFQQAVLRKVFEKTKFPSTDTRNNLSILLDIPTRSIQVWFQNRRQISRRKEKKDVGGLVNEYQKFVEKSHKSSDEEVYDVPLEELLEIIESCKDLLESE